MRTLALATLAVALLLAGCSSPSAPSAPSSSTSSSGGQGIAPGEPNPNGPGGGMLIRPAHNESSADGLDIVADESVSGIPQGGSVDFSFNATNQGADAQTVTGCGNVPYRFLLRDGAGKEHELDAPQVHCMAIGYEPFAHGQSSLFNRTWNGTYAEGDHLVQAPVGHYVLECDFTAQRGGAAAHVHVELPINVIANRGEG